MTTAPAMDLDKALLDPAAVFHAPHDVLHAPGLSPEDKKAILLRWQEDAEALMRATEEGMPPERSAQSGRTAARRAARHRVARTPVRKQGLLQLERLRAYSLLLFSSEAFNLRDHGERRCAFARSCREGRKERSDARQTDDHRSPPRNWPARHVLRSDRFPHACGDRRSRAWAWLGLAALELTEAASAL